MDKKSYQACTDCGALYAQLRYTEDEYKKDFAEKKAAGWTPVDIRDWLSLELLGKQMGIKREVMN